MAKEIEIELRNNEVTEILNAKPKWILRWGMTLILSLIAIGIVVCRFIKYPDILISDIKISAINSPVKLSAKRDLKLINLFVHNNDTLAANQIIGVFESTSTYTEIIALETLSKKLQVIFQKTNTDHKIILPDGLSIGELTPSFNALLSSINNWNIFHEVNIFKNNTPEQIKDQKNLELKLLHQQIELNLKQNVLTSLKFLSQKIEKWKHVYVIKSPIAGKISLSNELTLNQYIKVDKVICDILPLDKPKYFGISILSTDHLAKLKIGQKVSVKLTLYPYNEVGLIQGVIYKVSERSKSGNCYVYVFLKNGLTSSHNISIPFSSDLKGKAEIISRDISLLERIINSFKK